MKVMKGKERSNQEFTSPIKTNLALPSFIRTLLRILCLCE